MPLQTHAHVGCGYGNVIGIGFIFLIVKSLTLKDRPQFAPYQILEPPPSISETIIDRDIILISGGSCEFF